LADREGEKEIHKKNVSKEMFFIMFKSIRG